MNFEEQAIEEDNFRDAINAHLRNILARKVICGFFGTFYNEEKGFERCLLCEFRNRDGGEYFSQKRVSRICEFYVGNVQFRCIYEPKE